MEDRAVTVDVGTVKVQVAERPIDPSEDQTTLFSRSPFEIEKDPVLDRSSILSEIAPQLEFQVSDYVARVWSKRDGGTAAAAMRQARDTLAAACGNAQTLQTVRPALVPFV